MNVNGAGETRSDETCGREDIAEGLRAPHPTITARRNGENWRAPIITFNQYVTNFRV
jgi:hypothetical protein